MRFKHPSPYRFSISRVYPLQEEDAIFTERTLWKKTISGCVEARQDRPNTLSRATRSVRRNFARRLFTIVSSSWETFGRSSFIVVGSSIKVPTKFASRVTTLSSFPLFSTLAVSLSFLFPMRKRIVQDSLRQTSATSLPRPSSLLHLFFIFAERLDSPLGRFYPPPSHPDPFFPSSVRFGDNNRRTNGANLQSRLANGRSREARLARRDGRSPAVYMYVCSCETPENFSPNETALFAGTWNSYMH